MTARIKRYVLTKVSHLFEENHQNILNQSNMDMLPVSLSPYTVHFSINNTEFLQKVKVNNVDLSKDFIDQITIHHSPRYQGLSFKLHKKYFIETFLNDLYARDMGPQVKKNPKKIVLDYSSPNIAKPFHMGHLRSTIIGNFIANINEHLGETVTRINYLGDWGKQFGLLQVGVEHLNYSDDQIKRNPIEMLYEAYVKANSLAESDESISAKAKEVFTKLESGSAAELNKWELYRQYTLDELKSTYDRLGMKFDEYHWESMYGSDVASKIVSDLVQKGIVKVHIDGHKSIPVNDREITLQKSDGTSLYLTRDIAAVLDRYEKYSFDRMLYIVDNAQTDHFSALFKILDRMDVPFKNRCEHVKFGRINGFSTRKGNVVFLKDILNEARDKMHQQQKESPNTKVNLDDEAITDVLGISAVVISDLNTKRLRNYNFVWDKILHSTGVSGIKLQYLHCRLWSLENYSGVELPTVCKAEYFQEPEAIDLIHLLTEFDNILEISRERMESHMFLNYLFSLTRSTSIALRVLQVKDVEKELGQQRLLLFHCVRKYLKKGLEILGVKPLNQM